MGRKTTASGDFMSVRAYARHRKCALRAVQLAIEGGRLKESLVYVESKRRPGKTEPKIRDPKLADLEWSRNTLLSKAPHLAQQRAGELAAAAAGMDPGKAAEILPPAMSLSDASAKEKLWKARRAELDYRVKAGELVNAREAANAWATAVATTRTNLLSVPSKARQRLPHLSGADLAALDELIREAMEALAASVADTAATPPASNGDPPPDSPPPPMELAA